MLVRNVSLAALWDAAEEAGVKLYRVRFTGRKDAFRFTLRPVDGRWQRIGRHGQRVNAVCYHGHGAFFKALYRRHPDAYVQTALARFRSASDLEAADVNYNLPCTHMSSA